MRVRRSVLSIIGLVATALLAMAPAQAAVVTEQWSKTQMTLNPTIYQTNMTYYTANFVAPATVSSTGKIVQTYHRWRVWDGPGTNGTLVVKACVAATNRCIDITGTPRLVEGPNGPYYESSTSVITTALAGLPANTQFRYSLRVDASVTKVLTNPIESSEYRLSVDWTA